MIPALGQGGNVAVPASGPVIVKLGWSPSRIGNCEVDASAFLLTSAGKVRHDGDMVFYNQPRSPEGTVTAGADGRTFSLNLAAMPTVIERVAFVATIHEAATAGASFGQATEAWIEVAGVARYAASPQGRTEAALILGEFYRRGTDWKFRAVGQGFAGGLGPLATHFGVAVDEAAPPASAPPPARVSLEKRLIELEKKDPQLVSLVKKVQVQLEKKNLAIDRAKVALCLDISRSMRKLYEQGKIDQLVQRIMALGYRFDDDAEIDVFLFAGRAFYYGTVGVANYRSLVRDLMEKNGLELGTKYGETMALVRSHYQGQKDFGELPVYVMFVTDGGTEDKNKTERELREASREPLFWQFMAIGRSPHEHENVGKKATVRFEFLEGLDHMKDRFLDNANFFMVEDPSAPSDEALYGLLMAEYPTWLRLAKQKGLYRA